MRKKTVLAVDLGAESGRVVAAHFDGAGLQLEELQRFANAPVRVRDTLHWDILRLWGDVQAGLARGMGLAPASIGLDTWGVDFALLDAQGGLLGNPVHYRDRRTEGMPELAARMAGRERIFEQTGIQFMPINTIYQLLSLAQAGSPQLAAARSFVTIPDLLNYWLTGTIACEVSNASTTQLYNPRSGAWATELMADLGIPPAIFPALAPPGTRLGEYAGVPVIAPACHDTGSAVAAVPMAPAEAAYISSGTWSLVGVELAAPLISPAALAANLTNEAGVAGTTRLLKNVMGLWIVQQCRAAWREQGHAYSYDDLVALAAAAPPLAALIDPDHPRLLPPGDHPAIIAELCRESGQAAPASHGAALRCVFESLALAYRHVLDSLAELTGRRLRTIHIVGGGAQNALLCQMTADATGLPVLAGPVEATVLGNALVQLIALGELDDLAQARQLVAGLAELRRYEPHSGADWGAAYARFRTLRAANTP
jgi:rhamnulokinase